MTCLAEIPSDCATERNNSNSRLKRSPNPRCYDVSHLMQMEALYLLHFYGLYWMRWADNDRSYHGDGRVMIRRMGGVERVEVMEATVRESDLRQRSNSGFSSTITRHMQNQLGGRDGDEAGHILAYTLGMVKNFFRGAFKSSIVFDYNLTTIFAMKAHASPGNLNTLFI